MKKIIFIALSMLTIIALDQFSKHLVLRQIMDTVPAFTSSAGEITEHTRLLASPLPFFNLVLTMNKGVSFSMFYSHASYAPYVLMVLALVIMLGVLYFAIDTKNYAERYFLCLVLAGAIGNFIDRVRFKGVVDFLDFHWFNSYHFPAFNVADSAITIGAILYITYGLFFGKK